MTESEKPASFLAGIAKADITPPMGLEMCGYGPYIKRHCHSVADPLYVRAIWLSSEAGSCVLISLDITGVDRAFHQAVTHAIAGKTGCDPAAIMIAPTHTHYAPTLTTLFAWGDVDEPYKQTVIEKTIKVACEAFDAKCEATVATGRKRIAEVGRNREQPDLGPIDTAAQIMRIDKTDGSTLTTVVNFGAHPVVHYPFTDRISADWCGIFCDRMAEAFDGAMCMFLQGSLGNINGNDLDFVRDNREQRIASQAKRVQQTADDLFDQVHEAVRELQPMTDATIEVKAEELFIPYDIPTRESLEKVIAEHADALSTMTMADVVPVRDCLDTETPEQRAYRFAAFHTETAKNQLARIEAGEQGIDAMIQVLRIGSCCLVGWPAEVYVELGLELRQRSPIVNTFVVNFANHVVGYIPTPWAYESIGQPHQYGTYPTYFTPKIYGTLPFVPEVGRLLVDRSLEMIREIRNG